MVAEGMHHSEGSRTTMSGLAKFVDLFSRDVGVQHFTYMVANSCAPLAADPTAAATAYQKYPALPSAGLWKAPQKEREIARADARRATQDEGKGP